MLCLTRKAGEQILIGPDVIVKVLEVAAGRVRLGIQAPPARPYGAGKWPPRPRLRRWLLAQVAARARSPDRRHQPMHRWRRGQPVWLPASGLRCAVQSRRWDSNPLLPRYEGGARPVEHRRHQEQPVLVSSQLDRGSEPRSPPEGLARRRSRASGGTRTRTRPFTGGVLDRSSCTGKERWPAGVAPAHPRFTAGSRYRFGFGHSAPTWTRTRNSAFAGPRDVPFTIEATTSTPARSRTWTCSFGGSHDVRFTTRASKVPGVGVEPTPAGSESAVLPLDDPGAQ